MFVVVAVPIGLALGLLLGGRLERLNELRLRWAWLAVAGFVAQVILFSDPVVAQVGSLGPPLYVASTVAVLVAVLANVGVPGMAFVALGAALNLVAILANGGFMPADPGALALAGLEPSSAYSNSVAEANPALKPLTDIYALPAGTPLANVFSVGDVVLAIGVAWVIVAAMRSPSPAREEA